MPIGNARPQYAPGILTEQDARVLQRLQAQQANVWATSDLSRLQRFNSPVAIALGDVQRATMPGSQILRSVPVNGHAFEWTRFDSAHLERVDTKRGLSAPIKSGKMGGTPDNSTLEYRSYATQWDVREAAVAAPPFDRVVSDAGFARRMVDQDREFERAAMLTTAANYNGGSNVTAISAGDEWDDATPGPVRTVMRTAIESLADLVGGQDQEVNAFFGDLSWRALTESTEFQTVKNIVGIQRNSAAQVEEWLNMRAGSITTGEFWAKEGPDAARARMYGDVVILTIDATSSESDTTYGSEIFAVDFEWAGAGVPAQPWFDPGTTTWFSPFHAASRPLITSPTAGWLITNTSTVA